MGSLVKYMVQGFQGPGGLFMWLILLTGMVGLAIAACSPTDSPDPATAEVETPPPAALADGHFHPKGNPPSEFTLKVLEEARDSLLTRREGDYLRAHCGEFAPVQSASPQKALLQVPTPAATLWSIGEGPRDRGRYPSPPFREREKLRR